MWIGLGACAVPSVNGSSTIHHKIKFVGFLREHKENFAHCVEQFLHVCKPNAFYQHFFVFFQYRLINVCWVRTETMVHLTFKENWFIVHLVRIVCKPHNVIKVFSVCQALYYCPHTWFFTFVKGMCHSISSNASDTCVAACLIGVVFTFSEGMRHSTSGYVHQRHMS